ncbi:Fur family transcriptional regulator, ferric uptake regulator [Nannocystis exedens]|uniref:Fur family transcriptional regulator, ferric uptake regulator n=1 Tax=Nannocystis exedens TaxID=54 RepID=A0A1I1V056_9BACT|nr:transcriptional repressor [Nannocystis exedens]PCC72251.1 transcriptional repressor [Nannocystis exedens]SFD76421.1 Fur family transcriptional regulator, ferric uptake regulator [Nannocystis exedens]
MARSKTPSLDALRALLRDAGLRCTAPRVAVLEHFQTHRKPLSHGELVEALADREFDAATIYRNLIDLEGAGLVSRVNVGDNVWRFELRDQDAETQREHPHFVCVECGEISCLEQVRIKLTPAPGSLKSVVNQVSEILLKGQCTRCA